MEPASFFAASRVVIVAGKGGVGKTVVSAAIARAAAARGLGTLLVEVGGTAAMHLQFGTRPLGYAATELLPSGHRSPGLGGGGTATVHGRSITPDDALVEWLEDHGMRRIARRLARTGALEVIATATPGIKDLLVLGKVKQLASRGDAGLIVVDAPAAGHAVSFLRAPSALAGTARTGPIQQQATDVLAMLGDPARCQVVLVTIPEETPVNELVETAYALEDEVGVHLGPIVVNGLYPELPGLDRPPTGSDPVLRRALEAAGSLRRDRRALQLGNVERLGRELPLEQIALPFLFAPEIGPDGSVALAGHLLAGIDQLPDRPT